MTCRGGRHPDPGQSTGVAGARASALTFRRLQTPRPEALDPTMWPFRQTPHGPETVAPALDAASIVRRARRLRFRVRPGAVSLLSGAYHGARPGVGLTFAELRAYEPGDDVRHLDWNVTARQGKPYVRRFVEERALTVRVVVDVSASMRFGPEGRSKADRAAQAAALIATAAVRNGDRVSLSMVSDRVEAELPPGGGDRHLARVVRALVVTPTTSRKSDLSAGLARLKRSTRRALVVLLSDFLAHDPLPSGVWRRAARRHEVLALRVVEPREEALPTARLVDLRDAESMTARVADFGARPTREAYARAASERRAGFRRWCSSTGIAGYELPTESDPIGPLIRIFHGRAVRRGRA
jgi:uncharacterized protein (DUF58 family)